MKKTTLFKKYILDKEILTIPVVPDALCAVIAQNAGFKAIGRAGVSGIHMLGKADVELATLTEQADCTAKIADAVDIPVFADGDEGHGGIMNTIRTVQLFEKAGAAGLFIEDQVFPQRCGHTAGKELISTEKMVAKIIAALDARKDPDFIICARTDAIAVDGINAAIDRGNIFREAGANLIFVDAPESLEHMRKIISEIDAPQLANMVLGGKTPILKPHELQELGFSTVVYPGACSCVLVKAVQDFFTEFHSTLDLESFSDRKINFLELFDLTKLTQMREAEEKYTLQGNEIVKSHSNKSRLGEK
ncbi:MAG: oxaloacetate decarboxylase [Gammaproteobacteria bacterium]|nr:oxaloacetate decarboxylase [Gammaproteobacteria bacterium]